MSYKVKNVYKESHIMDLNMMGISTRQKTRFSKGAFLFTLLPLVVGAALVLSTVMGDLTFFAECQNIPGGDICSISIK